MNAMIISPTESAHKQAALTFARQLRDKYFPEMTREQYYEIANDAEKWLTAYEGHLEAICKSLEKITHDAVNCSIGPVSIGDRRND